MQCCISRSAIANSSIISVMQYITCAFALYQLLLLLTKSHDLLYCAVTHLLHTHYSTYSALLSLRQDYNTLLETDELLQHMQSEGIPITTSTHIALLRAALGNKDSAAAFAAEQVLRSHNSAIPADCLAELIRARIAARQPDEAVKLAAELRAQGRTYTLREKCYAAVITAYGAAGEWDSIMSVLSDMPLCGVTPTTISLGAAFRAAQECEGSEFFLQWLETQGPFANLPALPSELDDERSSSSADTADVAASRHHTDRRNSSSSDTKRNSSSGRTRDRGARHSSTARW
jgi:pentatricopeptide repeat protein